MNAKLSNVEIHYEIVGKGAPVAVLGGPWLGHDYLRAMDALAQTRQVIYHDPRGTGRSALGGRQPLSIARAIADLEDLREKLGIERWSLLAHSFGAHVAMLYAAKHPERVDALVICNAGPPLREDLMKQFFGEMMGRRKSEDMKEIQMLENSGAYARHDVNAVERSFRLTYLPFFDDPKTAEALDFNFSEEGAQNAAGTEIRLFQELQTLDPVANLAKIACPTLVVHSEHDPLPEAWSRFLAERISGAELALVPNANHFAFVEQPDAFFGVVRPFLARAGK